MLRITALLIGSLLLGGCTDFVPDPRASSSQPTDRSSPTTAPTPSTQEAPVGTITLIPFATADGGGVSIADAVATAPVEMSLVNGSLLIDAAGQVWLCDALGESLPPTCVGRRLRVVGFSNELPADIQEAQGVRWLPQPIQLFGDVTVP